MKRRICMIVLLLLSVILNAQQSPLFYNIGIPKCNDGACHEVHEYEGFILCYNEELEIANWVAYELTKEELVSVTDRSDNFRVDPNISTGSAKYNDYTYSGYDRGHLAPAADMSWSENAMSESFYMSNITPQLPSLNRKCWKYLEEDSRYWANRFGEVYIISGPILLENSWKCIGDNDVAIPDAFFKIIYVPSRNIAIAFMVPNFGIISSNYFEYVTTINEIELITGMDFLSGITNEEEVESMNSTDVWME